MNKIAVGHESCFKGIKIDRLKKKEDISLAFTALIPNDIQNEEVIYLCIGTDRVTGDTLAPFVGTYLEGLGYENVIGTIDNPVHAVNLREILDNLPKNKVVIAIDACLGHPESVGTIQVIKGSIKPGAGVNKDLPSCGDYAISGIVNTGGDMPMQVLGSTRLSIVIKMAKDITSALIDRFPLESEGEKPMKSEELKMRI